MQDLQPRNLSNSELIRLSAIARDSKYGMSGVWQRELLRRFIALAPLDAFPAKDPAQKDLFI